MLFANPKCYFFCLFVTHWESTLPFSINLTTTPHDDDDVILRLQKADIYYCLIMVPCKTCKSLHISSLNPSRNFSLVCDTIHWISQQGGDKSNN